MTMEERLGRLEWQNRSMKRIGAAALAVVAFVLLAAQGRAPDSTLRAKRFVVTDEAGAEWGQFGLDAHGVPMLSVSRPDDKIVVTLAAEKDRFGLWMRGTGGPRLHLCAEGDATDLRLYSSTQSPRAILRVGPDDEETFLTLLDARTKRRVRVRIRPDGAPVFEALDADGASVWRAPGE
jgi:hypothetical protein